MTILAMRMRASGKPIRWAASKAVTVWTWASGFARPISSWAHNDARGHTSPCQTEWGRDQQKIYYGKRKTLARTWISPRLIEVVILL
mgnify:CR=1 FL=1